MTAHVLDQLPLWVEGDLSREERVAVDRHLADCPACCEAAERLRQSQVWLREALTPPFEATDHERLSRAVMDRLRAEPPQVPARRFAAAPGLLAAAAVLVVAVLTWNRPPGKAAPRPHAGGIPETTPSSTPGSMPGSGTNPTAEAAEPPASSPPLPPRLLLARAAHAQAQFQSRLRPESAALARGEPIRIEFQTADPTIRIIWLAQATPLPGTNPSLEEKP